MRRESGILLSVASLPSRYGIGCFSKEAYEFVDQLKAAGQSYWQILPLGPTSYGDSPYQSFSTFAGNPYYISLEDLIDEGLLTREECEAADLGDDAGLVDYEKLYENRFPLLRKAYERSGAGNDREFLRFKAENAWWLDDYALYMAVKARFDQAAWTQWAKDIRLRWQNALDYYRRELYFDIEFHQYLQYLFMSQWNRLKAYANSRGIRIVGDIPIYVALDSADTWASPELFQLDENNAPQAVAGCPPDGFSATGQLWGNPLYRWDYHRQTGYGWWIKRLSYCYRLYDVVRIDHFRGFDQYFSIPAGAENAVGGHWEQGPGIELCRRVKEALGDKEIIAEDLGFLTPSVRKLLTDTGFPGMKVLEFAFNSKEESDYLPYNYNSNCVVYTGTHDNDTLVGWYKHMEIEDKEFSMAYLGSEDTPLAKIHWDFIRLALSSVARLAVIPVQDYLGLGSEARVNEPSTLGKNWRWRMLHDELDGHTIRKCRRLAKIYGRLREEPEKENAEQE